MSAMIYFKACAPRGFGKQVSGGFRVGKRSEKRKRRTYRCKRNCSGTSEEDIVQDIFDKFYQIPGENEKNVDNRARFDIFPVKRKWLRNTEKSRVNSAYNLSLSLH
uniref:Uncharacterized protein n=1 Tax=Timema cristinae TaxID=61476 RepID=A0A7R9DDX8_TIMCR|nr:unnamed protein product [Timema cristinae]